MATNNEKNIQLKTALESKLWDYIGAKNEFEEFITQEIRFRIVDAFIALAQSEKLEMDSSFGNQLRKIFENEIINAKKLPKEIAKDTMTKKIESYSMYQLALGNGIGWKDKKAFLTFWENSCEASHAHDTGGFFKKHWIPFLEVLNFHFKMRLGSKVFKKNPFKDEFFDEFSEYALNGGNKIEAQEETKQNKKSKLVDGKKFWGIDLGTRNSAISYYVKPGVYGSIEFEGKNSISSAVVINKKTKEMVATTDLSLSALTSVKDSDNIIITAWKVEFMNGPHANETHPSLNGVDGLEHVTPVFLSSLIIEKLLEKAMDVSGETIENLVITVPANFGEIGKENTRNALKMLQNFEHLAEKAIIFEEPVAAMFSSLKDSNDPKAATVGTWYRLGSLNNNELFSVFDMGAGTTDVSVVSKTSSKLKSVIELNVINRAGFDFAGRNIDSLILESFIFKAISDQTNLSIETIKSDDRELEMLMKYAEQIKIALAHDEMDFDEEKNLNILGENYRIEFKVNYEAFKKMIIEKASPYLGAITDAIRGANKTTNDVNNFILAGGSSQAPWIREMIADLYPELESKLSTVDPEVAISLGAAIFGNIQENTIRKIDVSVVGRDSFNSTSEGLSVVLNSSTSKNYGFVMSDGSVSWFLSKNTSIPTKEVKMNYRWLDRAMQNDTPAITVVEADRVFPGQYLTKVIARPKIKNNKKSKDFSIVISYVGDIFRMKVVQSGEETEYRIDPKSNDFIEFQESFEKSKRNFRINAELSVLDENIDDQFEKACNLLKSKIADSNKDKKAMDELDQLFEQKDFISHEEKVNVIYFAEKYEPHRD